MVHRVDNYTFHNDAEVARYQVLKAMKADHKIRDFAVVTDPFVLVKAYHKCVCCGSLSGKVWCELCGSKTYSSGGITYHPTFLVYENNGNVVIEDVMASLSLPHAFNMKKILYDQICTMPLYLVVEGQRYHKTSKGWIP